MIIDSSCLSFILLTAILFGCDSSATIQEQRNTSQSAASPQDKKNSDQEKSLTEKPQSIARLILNVRQYAMNQKYDQAVAAAREIVGREPNDARHHMLLADVCFMAGNMKDAIENYDRVIELIPQQAPYLWQRGLALYLADRFEEGVKQFETHQTVNSEDVENAVWHMLCNTKVVGLTAARKRLIPISKDTRIPMAEVHKLFAGEIKPEAVIASVINSADKGKPISELSYSRRSARYYAHLYVGLYREMTGDQAGSIASMKQAVLVNPLPHNEVMGAVANVHLKLRTKTTAQATRQKSKTDR